MESILTHGQSKDIRILIDGEFYDAKLKNQNFVQSNWAGHKDVIQIRYSRQSPLAVKLRAVFQKSYAYLFAKKQELGRSKADTWVELRCSKKYTPAVCSWRGGAVLFRDRYQSLCS